MLGQNASEGGERIRGPFGHKKEHRLVYENTLADAFLLFSGSNKIPPQFSVKASRSCPGRLTCGGCMGGCVGVMRWLRGWFYLSYALIMGYAVVIYGFAAVTWDKNYKSIVVSLKNVIKTVIWLSVNRGLDNGYAPTPSHAATPLSPTVVLDTRPGLPIHLPFDNTLSQLVEKLTMSFSCFGRLSHIGR